jgi:hypothetical protein
VKIIESHIVSECPDVVFNLLSPAFTRAQRRSFAAREPAPDPFDLAVVKLLFYNRVGLILFEEVLEAADRESASIEILASITSRNAGTGSPS